MPPRLLEALERYAAAAGKENPRLILARQPEHKRKPYYWTKN